HHPDLYSFPTRRSSDLHLNFTNVNAPFTGIMDHLHVREGSLLEEGELLTTISDNSKMWIYFNVPEAEYLNYTLNKTNKNPLKVRSEEHTSELQSRENLV